MGTIQRQFKNHTSIYTGVYWHRDRKKWKVKLVHKQKRYYGGLFNNEEQAAMNVNLICDENKIERKNSMIDIKLDVQQVPNHTSQYTGVCWFQVHKKWLAQLSHNKKRYFGGYFDNEEHAAMSVNLLCDKYGTERKNQMIDIKQDAMPPQFKNKTSIYNGVYWQKHNNKWQTSLMHKTNIYYGGLFDNEEQAAMKINLLCDKFEIERKNPMINIQPDAIQQVSKQTSQYIGVHWKKHEKKWQARLMHNAKRCSGGFFDNEEHAAMSVNLLCDKYGKKRKNPTIIIEPDAMQQKINSTMNPSKVTNIVDEKVKVEDENILGGFKDECENQFSIKSKDEEGNIATRSSVKNNQKRKRTHYSIINANIMEETMKIETTYQ